MAYYALASLKQTMMFEFVKPNPRVSLRNYAAVISLFIKLSSMEAFLWEKSRHGGAEFRDLEIKIRDFALKTEDAIEMKVRDILQPANGSISKFLSLLDLHLTLRKVAKDAEGLLNIINNTTIEAQGANIDTHSSILLLGGSSRCSLESDEIMVGKEHHKFFRKAERLLLRTYHCRTVIPIVGMAGVGKTTLARRVYKDPFVASNFDIKAWVTVSHECNLQQILCDLLDSMTPTVRNSEGNTLFQLKEQLHKHLKGKRYFIVLDDVWSINDYNDIQNCLPNDPCGSCILLTTLFHGVVVGSYSHMGYEVKFLNKDESWELFQNNLSLDVCMTSKFEEIAKHIVNQCEGLPRSIVVVAERLSKCKYTLKEWRKVEKEIDSLGALCRDIQYSSKLTFIYNQLPPIVKVQFLYFALFPKGCEIQVTKLLRLWMAEGILESPQFKANGCLQLLTSRSLLLIRKESFDIHVKTYWMHGAVRSFCVREAQKEGLFCAVDTQQCLGWSLNMLENSFRWLSLCSHKLDYYVFFSTNNPHSVFFYQGDLEMFEPFKLLRILDFSPSFNLKSVPLHLGDLNFLRYLSVPKWFEGLDDVVASNQNLQTIIISNVKSKHGAPAEHLSSRVWELPQLCHLELGNMYTVDLPSMDKEHLETLSWASPTHLEKEVHWKFPNLRKLKLFYKGVFEHSGTCKNLITIFEDIEHLSKLETLQVIFPVGCKTLVEWLVFPEQLKKLSLRRTNLSMNVLKVISQLPYLESLKLEVAFNGGVWEVVEGEFPKLKSLFLEARNLEQWVVDANHFPNLKNLVMRRCYVLKEIPRDFVKFRKLWSIELRECPPSVVTSVKWIREEAYNKRNEGIYVIVDGVEFQYPNLNIEEPAAKDDYTTVTVDG